MIYKYFPANEYSLSALETQRLFCRHFDDFNDPFEIWSRLITGVPTPEEPERLESALHALGVPNDDAEEHAEYFSSLEEGQPYFKLMLSQARIACFSRDSRSLLMWGHYADGLRGFCVEFDEQSLIKNPDEHYFTDVEYMKTPPTVDSFLYAVAEDQFQFHLDVIGQRKRREAYFGPDPISDDEYQRVADDAFEHMVTIWRRVFAVKPLEWRYERERRLLIMSDEESRQPVFHPYPSSAIKSVIVGERMSSEYLRSLEEVITRRFPQTMVCSAIRSPDRYGLEIRPQFRSK